MSEMVSAAGCIGYVQGFREALAVAKLVGVLPCVPGKATNGQLARVIVKHLEENPQNLHHAKSAGAYAALIKAYPCPK